MFSQTGSATSVWRFYCKHCFKLKENDRFISDVKESLFTLLY